LFLFVFLIGNIAYGTNTYAMSPITTTATTTKPTPGITTTRNNNSGQPPPPPSDRDQDCAFLARAALFPPRMHRDVAHSDHFPALAVLERYRRKLMLQQQELSSASITASSLFPPRIVVVRNLADPNAIQWNGQPDIDVRTASFDVVPHRLRVRCTSQCEHFARAATKMLLMQSPSTSSTGRDDDNNSSSSSTSNAAAPRAAVLPSPSAMQVHEIVLCTPRLLKKDVTGPLSDRKDMPMQSFNAVEEVLARELVKLASAKENGGSAMAGAAQVEIEAARAAECYYSRHLYDGKTAHCRRGSGLPVGYGWYPLQHRLMERCVVNTAARHLREENNATGNTAPMPLERARRAVRDSLHPQQ
jgi:hypothetical protein